MNKLATAALDTVVLLAFVALLGYINGLADWLTAGL